MRSAPTSRRSRRRCAIAWRSSKSWDDVKLLTVKVDRLAQWHRPGLLCIGDAAHAMSPVGGVGINLAIQDAVAAANRLAAPLRAGSVAEDDLAAVQRRRMFPTRATQRLQICHPEQRAEPRAGEPRGAVAAVAGAAARPLPAAAADSGPAGRPRHPARARAHARGGAGGRRALDKPVAGFAQFQ